MTLIQFVDVKTVGQVLTMLETLSKWVDEIPPIQQPQRFGNQAFRTWFNKLKEVFSLFINHTRYITL